MQPYGALYQTISVRNMITVKAHQKNTLGGPNNNFSLKPNGKN
jgi:hypothetical protein